MSGRRRRNSAKSSAGAARSRPGANARVAWRSGWCTIPSATNPPTNGPGAEAVCTSNPAAWNARSCGPSNSSRLMSVVVTWRTSVMSLGLRGRRRLEVLDVVGRRHDPTGVEDVGGVADHEVEVEVGVVGEHHHGVGGPELLGGEGGQ